MKTYDAIVIGAGHNGLINACYLAKAGLDVVVLERNDYIGGAAVSRELHPGLEVFQLLLRLQPAAARDRPRPGAAALRPAGGALRGQPELHANGDYLATYADHDANAARDRAPFAARRRGLRALFKHDVMRQCRFIKPLLMRTPPDPTSPSSRATCRSCFTSAAQLLGPRRGQMYDTLRFWTMSIAEYLDEYFECDIVKATSGRLRHHRHRPRALFAGLRLRAAAPLHGRGGRHHRRLGLLARRHGRHHPGAWPHVAAGRFGGEIRTEAGVERILAKEGRTVRRRARAAARRFSASWMVISNMDVKRTFLECMDRQGPAGRLPRRR